MADRLFVRALWRLQLEDQNGTALFQAGPQWEEMPMSHYYQNEKQVNDDSEKVMKSAIDYPANDLPDRRWKELKEKVNLSTLAKDTITTTTELSAFAVSTEPVP